MKRIALVVAVLLAACGTEKAPQSDGNGDPANPDPGMAGAIPLASFVGTTAPPTAKVVLKTARAFYTPLTQTDPADPEGTIPYSCAGTSVATCPAVANVACVNSQCVQINYRLAPFFIRDVAPYPSSIPVPCDGGTYVAEIYGAGTPAPDVVTNNVRQAGSRDITEISVSSEFTMSTACAATGLDWTSATAANPTALVRTDTLATIPARLFPEFAFAPIYVGMGAGFENFNVTTLGQTYPWAFSNWTVSYTPAGSTTAVQPTNAANMTSVATFPAPAVAGDLSFTGSFILDRGLLVQPALQTGDRQALPGAWVFNVPAVVKAAVAAGPVTLP